MVGSFICGGNSFPREEEEHRFHSADSSPRKSSSRSKDIKNPYSDRGLDKFSALLAEIEEKRQKIYSELGPEEISLVRFVYSNDNNIKPIVVKAKSKEQQQQPRSQSNSGPLDNHHHVASSAAAVVEGKPQEIAENKRWRFQYKLKQPSCYWPAVVILILFFLVLFGRSVAILCTSIGWYLLPTMTHGSSNLKRSMKKKDYARRLSDKKMLVHGVSPLIKGHDHAKSDQHNGF
ncbi:hypothetical protein Nepgr_005031 [Nepenthes gracilis]|uniref:ZCF37 n=1 Tax=Nepenthes gracilis TaxID=150966 RepID=A0AAD3XG16_NEPGR|nr:hypothetical protein Nepgr_005031 [Nepenthes gracilis]